MDNKTLEEKVRQALQSGEKVSYIIEKSPLDMKYGEFLETLPEEFSGLLQTLPEPKAIFIEPDTLREVLKKFSSEPVIPLIEAGGTIYYYQKKGEFIVHTFISDFNSPTEPGHFPAPISSQKVKLLTVNVKENISNSINVFDYTKKYKEIKSIMAEGAGSVLLMEQGSISGVNVESLASQLSISNLWKESSKPLPSDSRNHDFWTMTEYFMNSIRSVGVFDKDQNKIEVKGSEVEVSFSRQSTIFPGIFLYEILWEEGGGKQNLLTTPTWLQPESASVTFLTSDILRLPK